MDHLVQKEFINIQGHGNEESIFVNKSISDFLRNFNFEPKNCETQMDQEKGNCSTHENMEEDTGTKELEIFFDNIDLNASPAKPDNTHILYERLIPNLQSDVLFLRHQLKTRDLYFREEITYLRNQLDDCLRCFRYWSKKENNASIHQKRKPSCVETSSASESTEKQKADIPAKDNIGENKKSSSSGSSQIVTSDQSLRQPNNGKQAPNEKAKTEDSSKEKQTKKKYDKAFKRLGHFCKSEITS